MIKNIWFISLCIMLLSYSCINDDSELPLKPISEITIKTASDTINVDYGFEMVLDPIVEQTMEGMELKYEWMYHGYKKGGIGGWVPDSLKFLSNEKVLKHTFRKLGKFGLRLKVSNEHGSSFKKWDVNVNAAFEQGIFVLSTDENKKGRVSFMRPLTKEEEASGKEEKFQTDAFASVNPEFALNDPVDAAKIGSDMFLLSRADQLVYRLDARTFQMVSITDFKKEMPWVKPQYLCSMDRSLLEYLVFSEDGGFAKVDYRSDIPSEGYFFYGNKIHADKKYTRVLNSPIPPDVTVSRMTVQDFFLDFENSTVNYSDKLQEWRQQTWVFPEEELINIDMNKMPMTCIVTRSKASPDSIFMHKGMYNSQTHDPFDYEFPVYKYKADQITMTKESIVQNNDIYNWTYYTNNNKLYRWMFHTNDPKLPTEPVIILDEGCEITCFDFTADFKKILLGVYNPKASGMKGSVYVYDADKINQETKQLKFYKKYEGVADKPIKIFWKNNRY